ncbi:MAG: glycosyltransferase family 39 protein [Chloroflexi bacterium]|nr:glycosyltransferase family 39 protein [Chloroflexota bacterium]
MGALNEFVRARPLAVALLLCAVVAASLRVSLISGERFHPDEALYATWARDIATGRDVWLAERIVDKPPLFIYVLALPFATVGASEELARLPNLIASVASVVLTGGIAQRLYGDLRVAVVAAIGMALSPIAMLFSVTAFADPFMLMWALAAVWAALGGRIAWCGFLCGLALATKQDALLLLPVLVAIGWAATLPAMRWRAWLRGLAGLSVPVGVVAVWVWMRPQPDFLSASLLHYAPLTWSGPATWLERANQWAALSATVAPAWLLPVAAIVFAMCHTKRTVADLGLPAVALVWIGLHVVISFPVWDRYALPLAPVAAIWLARAGVLWYDRLRAGFVRPVFCAAWVFCLVAAAGAALSGAVDVARDYGRHAGIDAIGAYFWTHDTSATVLYVHDLSWEIDYYTYGRELDRRWFQDATALASDAAHMSRARRFVALTDAEWRRGDLPDALAARGLQVERVETTARVDGRSMVQLLRIVPVDR